MPDDDEQLSLIDNPLSSSDDIEPSKLVVRLRLPSVTFINEPLLSSNIVLGSSFIDLGEAEPVLSPIDLWWPDVVQLVTVVVPLALVVSFRLHLD